MWVKRHFLCLFFTFMAFTAFGMGSSRANISHNDGQINAQAPDIYFYGKSRDKITLGSFKGKVVLLNFWATWCAPCKAEMPALDHLQQILPRNQFNVIAVSMDDDFSKVKNFFKMKDISSLVPYIDTDHQIPLKWKYSVVPTTYLIDQKGKIIARYEGPYHWDEKSKIDEIKKLLK